MTYYERLAVKRLRSRWPTYQMPDNDDGFLRKLLNARWRKPLTIAERVRLNVLTVQYAPRKPEKMQRGGLEHKRDFAGCAPDVEFSK